MNDEPIFSVNYGSLENGFAKVMVYIDWATRELRIVIAGDESFRDKGLRIITELRSD